MPGERVLHHLYTMEYTIISPKARQIRMVLEEFKGSLIEVHCTQCNSTHTCVYNMVKYIFETFL